MSDFNDRAQKSVDIASTYVQVLIGLASGIIAAVLAFYPDILSVPNFNFQFLKYALISLGASVASGLCGLGGLINKTGCSKTPIPTDSWWVRVPYITEFVAFGLGLLFVILSIP